jgi:membrane-bound serine protease (ClpP class)
MFVATCISLGALEARTAIAQDAAVPEPIGRFVNLRSPINDGTIGEIRQAALALLDQSRRESRAAVLVLELEPGLSQFHHVYALADLLTSSDFAALRTVAWVPETLTGPAALVPLACSEIVLSPTAQLGDIGHGESLTVDQQAVVAGLIARGRNRRVSPALARAMVDPQAKLLQLTIEHPDGVRERRLVTAEEAQAITESGVSVPLSQVLKEPGSVGIFSGEQSLAGEFLVEHLAGTTREAAALYGLGQESLLSAEPAAQAKRASLIEIRGPIDTVMSTFLQRQIGRAVESGSDVILFEIQSPGGRLEEVRDLALAIAHLRDRDVRTVAWIPEMAIGEAALIPLACDAIVLAPEARLGAIARRRELQPNEDDSREQEFLGEVLHDLAELKERPEAILLAMAQPKLQVFAATHRESGETTFLSAEQLELEGDVWLRGPLVPESGAGLLTVGGRRAEELGIANRPAASVEEVRTRFGLGEGVAVQRIEKTWVDDLVFKLNRPFVTGMLLALALVLIYMEMHFTSGALGIAALLCFALFFWSRFLGGTAGALEVMLFVLGLALLAVELFVIPGFGVFGLSGGGMILVSLVLASQTFGHIESGRDFSEATSTLKTISAAIVVVIAFAALINRYLPRVPFLDSMVLNADGRAEAKTETPRLRPDLAAAPHRLMGERGEAVTMLRPAGKARLAGELWDVVSEGPFIAAGARVEVVRVSGKHVTVREA